MSIKKKADNFNKDLIKVLEKHIKKVPPEAMMYVMANELIYYSVAAADNKPGPGLNEMFAMISVAAGEQGYRLQFEEPPTYH